MHVGDRDAGMLPAIAIVGGGIPLAAGCALSFQSLKQPNIVACFFMGLGAGGLLPIAYSLLAEAIPAKRRGQIVVLIAGIGTSLGFLLASWTAHWLTPTYGWAAARARDGAGPTLLELETYRLAGHSRSDPGHYRAAEEVAGWKVRDPIAAYETRLLAEGLLRPKAVAEIRSAIDHELDEAVARAEQGPEPRPEDCLSDVFSE